MEEKRYAYADMNSIVPADCPCGKSRRAFIRESDGGTSFHVVEIKKDAQRHYHKTHTEIYYILEGTGIIEADEARLNVKPGDSVLIKPLCRHRAVGALKIVNVSIPAFDPADEWFD